jgi:hypothetical protein
MLLSWRPRLVDWPFLCFAVKGDELIFPTRSLFPTLSESRGLT